MTTELTSPATTDVVHPLDDAIRESLRGEHAHFARWSGRVARYHPDVAPHVGHPPPPGWEVLDSFGLVQMDGTALDVAPDQDAEVLGADDVPEILNLIGRTRPGPYLPRTIEMGTYLGFRVDGELVAMAGERLHPPGWTEISAVCTDERFRGRGFGTRLVRAVGAGIRPRGEMTFLHAAQSNTTAIRLYESLGFTLRRQSALTVVRTPA